jgi:endoglucanase
VTSFSIADALTGDVVFTGPLAIATQNTDTADVTSVADFTAFDVPGTYVVKIDGLSTSPKFVLAPDSLNDALRVTMLGLYGQRCGVAVRFEHNGNTFSHAACHLDDALQNGKRVDGTGGWHDAGDYGKYTVNAAFALAFLLKAWEDFGDGLGTLEHIPNRTGTLPAWLDEAKFQLDQILKMQLADGSAAHMLGPWMNPGPAAFPGMVTPEQDFTERAFSGIGTGATADLAAVTAMASRVFRPFDAEYADLCLAAARQADAYLDQHPAAELPSFANFTHNAYGDSRDADERFWAKVELWRTTQEPGFLTAVESSLRQSIPINFDWANVDNLGMFSYVQAKSDARDPAKLKEATRIVLASADALTKGANTSPYGRGVGAMYYWGSNGVVARSAMNLFVAYAISPEPKPEYLDAAVQQIDHLLGRNPFGRSFVTGLGFLPAMNPHHRQSQGDAVLAPWPGLLVGGPNSGRDDDPVKMQKAVNLAPGLVWFDDSGSYGTNEIAINWNTALAYALAGFYR